MSSSLEDIVKKIKAGEAFNVNSSSSIRNTQPNKVNEESSVINRSPIQENTKVDQRNKSSNTFEYLMNESDKINKQDEFFGNNYSFEPNKSETDTDEIAIVRSISFLIVFIIACYIFITS